MGAVRIALTTLLALLVLELAHTIVSRLDDLGETRVMLIRDLLVSHLPAPIGVHAVNGFAQSRGGMVGMIEQLLVLIEQFSRIGRIQTPALGVPRKPGNLARLVVLGLALLGRLLALRGLHHTVKKRVLLRLRSGLLRGFLLSLRFRRDRSSLGRFRRFRPTRYTFFTRSALRGVFGGFRRTRHILL